MKYFIPERYLALQDFLSDAAMDAADAEWDREAETYSAYYHSVASLLPPEFRQLQEGYYLHDAEVLYVGQQRDRFFIALRLDPPPQQVLQLSYELTGQPQIHRNVLPPAYCQQNGALWMYDEVELVSQTPPFCVHSRLLSNGWEVQLRFRALRIEEVQVLLPIPQTCDLNRNPPATLERE